MRYCDLNIMRQVAMSLLILFVVSGCGTTNIVRNLKTLPDTFTATTKHPQRLALVIDKEYFSYEIFTAHTWVGNEKYIIRSPADMFFELLTFNFESVELFNDMTEINKEKFDLIARMSIEQKLANWHKGSQSGCPIPSLFFTFTFEDMAGKSRFSTQISYRSCSKYFSLINDQKTTQSFVRVFTKLSEELNLQTFDD
ncbi:MAG: hypothetical protein ABIK92_15290 [Pseudomonadota bacterium]